MSLRFIDDKIMTSNPFIDLILYNLKVLGFNCVIKDQKKADNAETAESIKNAGLYEACLEGHAVLGLFDYIPHDFLKRVGMTDDQIWLYENFHDQYYIPDRYHQPLLDLLVPWFIDTYVETNEYYRMLLGKPPMGDPGIPMRDYEYLFPEGFEYTGDFIDEIGVDLCTTLDDAGVLDVIKADYPDAKYLDYITYGLDIYTIRNKLDFQILWYPSDTNVSVTQEFLYKYQEDRDYMLATVYTSAMEIESEYYHSVMQIYLILITMIDILVDVQSHIVKKDILDRRCIQYIFEMFGIPYYREIPYKYQERMCKNVYQLIKYKSCTTEMINLIDLFGVDNIEIFKWYLLKNRKMNAWGEFEYVESTQLVCAHNDIIEHSTLTENMNDPSPALPVPPNLDWYDDYSANNGSKTTDTNNLNTFMMYRVDPLAEGDEEENPIQITGSHYFVDGTLEYEQGETESDITSDMELEKGNINSDIDSTFEVLEPEAIPVKADIDGTFESDVENTSITPVDIDVDTTLASGYNTQFDGIIEQVKVNYIERYIKYPFDYFLQKGNVMFVKLDGRVLVENVDYRITNYNKIRFLNEDVALRADKVTYEFYWDKTTVDQDFIVDTDHKVEIVTKQYKPSQDRSHTLDLKPVPWKKYFVNKNQVIVMTSSIMLSPDMYKIDFDNYTLTISNDVDIDDRDVWVILIYSGALLSQFDKATVVADENDQDTFFIPEPFMYYCLNENEFFVTLGTTFIEKSRYEVRASETQGMSVLHFTDGTKVEKGRTLVFNFLYSMNSIINPMIVKKKTITVTATRAYQYEFEIDFPVAHYASCNYKVFIKLLGWYLPEEMFTFTNDKIIFTDQSIALQPEDTMDVTFVYVDKDRTLDKYKNIIVAIDHRVATEDKQYLFDIEFPVEHYFTKHNVLLVDYEGTLLEEGKDYTVDFNKKTVTLLTLDYMPMYGQRINYTFFYNFESEYVVHLDYEQIRIETKNQNVFSLNFPFFPYLQTGQDFLVFVGSTMIAKSRIKMINQFEMQIDGLETTRPENSRYITVVYIYNNYYMLNKQEGLIVQWTPVNVIGGQDHLEIPTPFEDYIENDWPYFVTHHDRQWLDDDDYEVYNSTFYTYPSTDLLGGKYGDVITFTFIYLIREGYVYEEKKEDYRQTTDLYFCKIPIDDLYSSQYLKDPSNWKSYYAMVSQDGWWYGKDFKDGYEDEVLDDIYESEYNYARTKYYTMAQRIDLSEYGAIVSYFYSMLYDDVLLEELCTVKVPSLSASHPFKLADLFIYMTLLAIVYEGGEDFTLDIPDELKFVSGFNMDYDLDLIREYLRKHHRQESDFPIWDFIIPEGQIPDVETFFEIFKTDLNVRNTVARLMVESEDYPEYQVWRDIYDNLMRWELKFDFFKLKNGQVATTYREFLRDRDIVLYNSLVEISSITDYETRCDQIIEIIDSIVYILDEWLKGEYHEIFDRFPGQSGKYVMQYLMLMIIFFKSHKIMMLSRGEQLEIGTNGNSDEDSTMRGYDNFLIKEIDNYIEYYPLIEVFHNTETIKFSERSGPHENGKWMREDFEIIEKHIDTHKYIKENISFRREFIKKMKTYFIDGVDVTLNPTEAYWDILSCDSGIKLMQSQLDNNGKNDINGTMIVEKHDVEYDLFDCTMDVKIIIYNKTNISNTYEFFNSTPKPYMDPNGDITGSVELDSNEYDMTDLDITGTIDNTTSIEYNGGDHNNDIIGIIDDVPLIPIEESDTYDEDNYTISVTTGELASIPVEDYEDYNEEDYSINGIDLELNLKDSTDSTDIDGTIELPGEDIDLDNNDGILCDVTLNKVDMTIDIITPETNDDGEIVDQVNLPNREKYSDEDKDITGDLDIEESTIDTDIDGTIDTVDKWYIDNDNSNIDIDDYTIEGTIDEYTEASTNIDIDSIVDLDKEDTTISIDIDNNDIILESDTLEDDIDHEIEGSVMLDNSEYEDTSDLIIEGSVEFPEDSKIDYAIDVIGPELDDEGNPIAQVDLDRIQLEYDIDGSTDYTMTEDNNIEHDIEGQLDIDKYNIEDSENTDPNDLVIDGTLNIDNNYTEEEFPTEVIVPKLSTNTDMEGKLTLGSNSTDEDIDSDVELEDRIEHNTNIIDATNVRLYEESISKDITIDTDDITLDKGSVDKDIDTMVTVQEHTITEEFECTMIVVNRIYKKRNISSGYQFISYAPKVLTKDINGSVNMEIPYTGFTINSISIGEQQGTAIRGQESELTYNIYLTVSDISHLVDSTNSDKLYSNSALWINISNINISSTSIDNITINGNNIHFSYHITGTWNADMSYSAYVYLKDDMNYQDNERVYVRITTVESVDTPLPSNASVRIDSSNDSDRRTERYTGMIDNRYIFTSSYRNWDVFLTNCTIDQLDLANIEMNITSSTNKLGNDHIILTFDETSDKGSTTQFGLGWTIKDEVPSTNTNYDYTINVRIPAGEGYSGYLETQFTIKLRVQ